VSRSASSRPGDWHSVAALETAWWGLVDEAQNDFSFDDVVEEMTKGIVAEDANDESGPTVRERTGQPLDELGEIEEKDRLDFGLPETEGLRFSLWRPDEPDDHEPDNRSD
jgi:hypothetical protein